MVAVKICGLNDAEGVDAAVAGGADYLGFVFFPPSPRYVSPAAAAALAARHGTGPLRVGLFVEPEEEAVATVLARVPLDILQVHASPAQAAALRARFGLPVWRAVPVASAADLPAAAPGIDGLLLDAAPPRGATRPGGNARAFDWSLLRGWHAPCFWLLAGGLTAQTLPAALAATGAPAVDVSSGVESAPGRKDPARIAAFLAAARAFTSR